jgi:hypothetical protein
MIFLTFNKKPPMSFGQYRGLNILNTWQIYDYFLNKIIFNNHLHNHYKLIHFHQYRFPLPFQTTIRN